MNYLLELLRDYAQKNNLSTTKLSHRLLISQPRAVVLLNGKQNITYQQIAKIDTDFDLDILKEKTIELLQNSTDAELITKVYNKLYEDEKRKTETENAI